MINNDLKFYTKALFKGGIAVSLAQSATMIVGIFVLPVLTFYLSPEEFGIVSMTTLVIGVLNLIYNPGMMSATTRLYHNTQVLEERQEIIGSAYRFFIFIPIVFILLLIPTGDYIFNFLFKDFKFYPFGFMGLLIAFFTQPMRIWTILMTLQYKNHITAIYSFISVIISTVITLLLVIHFNLGAMGKILGMFPSVLLIFIVSFYTIGKYSNNKWSFFSIKKQFFFGLPLFFAIISSEILYMADRYILERMVDLTSVGLYTFAYTVATIPKVITTGLNQLWSPMFYENMNLGNDYIIQKLSSIIVIILSTVTLVMILFSKEVVLLFANYRYYDAIPIISIITIGIFFLGVLTLTNSYIGYLNKFGLISKIAVISSLLNIVLNIFLIPEYGIYGSSFATLIAYFIYLLISIIFVWEYAKKINLHKILTISTLYIFTIFYLNLLLKGTTLNINEFIIKFFILMSYIIMIFLIKIIKVNEVINFMLLFYKKK